MGIVHGQDKTTGVANVSTRQRVAIPAGSSLLFLTR